MKKKLFYKKANRDFILANKELAANLACNDDELQVAIETCEYIAKNISFILKSERGILWPYDFFDYWSGKSMFEHGNANPFIVGRILSSYMLKSGIYIYNAQGKQIKEGEEVICEMNRNYYIVAPKYY